MLGFWNFITQTRSHVIAVKSITIFFRLDWLGYQRSSWNGFHIQIEKARCNISVKSDFCSFESCLSIDAWDLSPIFHYISSRKCKKVSLTIKVFVFNRNNQVDLREVNFQFIAISYSRT